MRVLLLSILFLSSLTYASMAEVVACTTSIKGEIIQLGEDLNDTEITNNTTFREVFRNAFADINCHGFITLRHMTPGLSDRDRSPFCLVYDEENTTYTGYQIGERDAYLVCKEPSKSICEKVNAGKEAFIGVVSGAAGAIGGTNATLAATGVSVVQHSSGAWILTGSSGYIAGTIGTAATTALGVLSTPAVIGISAISLVAVGGAVYICK